MTDVIEVNDRYYILAGSSLADDRKLVIKDADTFGVFDHYGDIHRFGLGDQGLFHMGTRHLSSFTLHLNGHRPLFLSSGVSADNDRITIHLSNPDLLSGTAPAIPRGTIYLKRTRLVWAGTSYERLLIQNFGLSTVPLVVTVAFDADFVDIFEVRGTERPRRGTLHQARHPGPGQVRLSYLGLDHVVRSTEIAVRADVPAPFDGSTVTLPLSLAPQTETEISIEIRCLLGEGQPYVRSFAEALSERARRLDHVVEEECRIRTASSAVNQSLSRCRADLHLMLSPTAYGLYPYAGVPWFSTPFGRDGLITALETLWLNPSIARGVLLFLAATQAAAADPENEAEPGKILHEMRSGEMATLGEVPFRRYYGSVDATPLFVALAGAYYRRTADLELIERLWPNIDAAIAWMDGSGDADADGFVEYEQRGSRGLNNQGWKDSHDAVSHADGTLAESPIALCEVQGYVFAARQAAALLAKALGDSSRASALRQQARALQEAFDRAFWLPDLGTYALALDREKAPCRVRSSNAGHCLFTGIALETRANAIADTLMAETSFSGWGIRSLDTREARFNPMSYHNGSVWPHDTAIIAAGLAHYGLRREAAALLDALIDLSQAVHLQRLPELVCGFPRRDGEAPTAYPVACAPQAWASGSLFLALEACLGLRIDALSGSISFEQAVLPQAVSSLRLDGLRAGAASVDLTLDRSDDHVSVKVNNRAGPIDVIVRV